MVDDFHWHLVYTKPRQESVARLHLERQGFRVFLPLIQQRRRVRRRYQVVIEALFPRYLFLGLCVSQGVATVRSTRGVAGLVSFGGVPVRVSSSLIQALQARGDAAGVVHAESPVFHPGDRVRVIDGALAGYEAIFQAATGADRVAVLLHIVGRPVTVEVPESALVAA